MGRYLLRRLGFALLLVFVVSSASLLLTRLAPGDITTDQALTLDPDARAKFDELRYLERSIGRTGRRAMQPFLHLNSRDLWQIHMLDR